MHAHIIHYLSLLFTRLTCPLQRVEMSMRPSKSSSSPVPATRHPFSKACLQHSQTVTQPCTWFMEEPCQFSVCQTALSLTCYIMEKPHTRLDDCLRMLQACFRKRTSDSKPLKLFLSNVPPGAWPFVCALGEVAERAD